MSDKTLALEVRLQASRALNDELRAENTRLREALMRMKVWLEKFDPTAPTDTIDEVIEGLVEIARVALAAASPKLSCTRCECLIFKVELYDEVDQPLCRDCYQELYAERDRAEEKWEWADIRIDRRRGT